MSASLRALLVEDNDHHAELLARTARGSGVDLQTRVGTLADARPHLRQPDDLDLVILDLNLPDSRGLDTLEEVVHTAPALPVVVLTSLSDDDTAHKALQSGAEDYLAKGSLSADHFQRTVRYAVERHQLLRRVRRQAEQLDQFAAAIAHDLEMPVCHLQSITQWLREDYGPMLGDVGHQHLRMLDEAAERMSALVDDLKTYTHAAGHATRPTPTDLRELVEAALDRLQKRLEETGSSVHVASLPSAIVDREQMQVVLYNLLSAGIGAPMGSPRRIRIAARSNARWCTLAIEQDARTFVGDEDAAWGWSASREVGMAMSLCRRVVEAHGGVLSSRALPDGGSLLWMTLPRIPPDISRAVEAIEHHRLEDPAAWDEDLWPV